MAVRLTEIDRALAHSEKRRVEAEAQWRAEATRPAGVERRVGVVQAQAEKEAYRYLRDAEREFIREHRAELKALVVAKKWFRQWQEAVPIDTLSPASWHGQAGAPSCPLPATCRIPHAISQQTARFPSQPSTGHRA